MASITPNSENQVLLAALFFLRSPVITARIRRPVAPQQFVVPRLGQLGIEFPSGQPSSRRRKEEPRQSGQEPLSHAGSKEINCLHRKHGETHSDDPA